MLIVNDIEQEEQLPTLNDALTGEVKTEIEEEQKQEMPEEVNESPKDETKDNNDVPSTNNNNVDDNNNNTPASTDVNKDHIEEPSTNPPETTSTTTNVTVKASPKTSGKKVTINDTQSKSPELSPSTYKQKSKLYKAGISMNNESSRRKLNSTFCEYNRTKKYDHFNSTYQRLQAKQQDRDIKLEILRQEKNEKEKKQMKGVPTINKNSTRIMSSTTKSFYERQQSFEKRKKAKQDKLEELKRLKEEEELYKCPRSARSGVTNGTAARVKSKKQNEEKELLELKQKKAQYKRPKASQKQIDNTIDRLYREEVNKRKENSALLKSLYTPSFTPKINALPKERKPKHEEKQQGKDSASKRVNSHNKTMKGNDEHEYEYENGIDEDVNEENNNDNEFNDKEGENDNDGEHNEVDIPIENEINNDYSNFCKEATNNPQIQSALRGKLFKKKKK